MSQFEINDNVILNEKLVQFQLDQNKKFTIKSICEDFVFLNEIPYVGFHNSLLRKAPQFKVGDVVTYYNGKWLIISYKWSDSHGKYLYDIVDVSGRDNFYGQDLSSFKLVDTHNINIGDMVCYRGLPYIAGNNSFYEWNGKTIEEFVVIELRDENTIYKSLRVKVIDVLVLSRRLCEDM